MTFDPDELREMNRLARKASHELDVRQARIVVLDFVVGVLVIQRFGGLEGFGILTCGSFVLGAACQMWASFRARTEAAP